MSKRRSPERSPEPPKLGRYDIVAQLAKEFEARRLARLPNVVPVEPNGSGKRSP